MQKLIGDVKLRDKRWKDITKYSSNRIITLIIQGMPEYRRELSIMLNELFPSLYFDENSEVSHRETLNKQPLLIFHDEIEFNTHQIRQTAFSSLLEGLNADVPSLLVRVHQERLIFWKREAQFKEFSNINAETSELPKISMVRKKDQTDEGLAVINPDLVRFNLLFFVGLSQWLAAITGAQEVEIPRPRSILSNVIWRSDEAFDQYLNAVMEKGVQEGMPDSEIYAKIQYDPSAADRAEPVFVFGKKFEMWVNRIKEKMARAEASFEGGGRSVSSRRAPRKPSTQKKTPVEGVEESSFFSEQVPETSNPVSDFSSTQTRPSSSSSSTLLNDDDLSPQEESQSVPTPSSKPIRRRAKPSTPAAPPATTSIFSHLLGKAPEKPASQTRKPVAQSLPPSSSQSPASPLPPSSSSLSEGEMDFPFSSLLKPESSSGSSKKREKPLLDDLSDSEDEYVVRKQRLNEEIGTNQQKLGALMQQLTRINVGDIQRKH